MQIPFHLVDAFTDRPLAGNPAGVCPLPSWPPDDLLVAVAAEVNASETAFLVADTPATPSPGGADFHLRWFTPTVEVDLCGHATLAAAHVVLHHLRPGPTAVTFDTRSGRLAVERDGRRLRMDLPAQPREPVDAGLVPDALVAALGTTDAPPVEVLGGTTWMVVLAGAAQVRALRPDIAAIAALDTPYVIVTAATDRDGGPDADVDFVSRYFAPGAGIDEDPVTGSAHCCLGPYWSGRLGKAEMLAYQASARGGTVGVTVMGDRVRLRGRAVTVMAADLLAG